MARKTDKITTKDFTKNIHSTRRSNTIFANMDNWNEKQAKEQNKISCRNCRSFMLGCNEYIGRWHKPCIEFKWD